MKRALLAAGLCLAGCSASAPAPSPSPSAEWPETTIRLPAPSPAARPSAEPSEAPALSPTPWVEPDLVTVQHLLIAFKGSGTKATRTKAEAKELADVLMAEIKAGADFDALVKEHTDDSPPGIYSMTNKGVKPIQGTYQRTGMVAAFGNVGFALQVGGVGLAPYDAKDSPYGWHIIKRLK